MKNFIVPFLTIGTTVAALAQKPNIVLFLVDDMGWQDTSVEMDTTCTVWNDTYRTPNMEKLAERGVRFTSAYASAISSPSRVSLLTGMNPAAHRVTNWTLDRNISQDQPSDLLEMPVWNMNGLQPVGTNIENSVEANTLPEILRNNGYTTILCGKAHFGAKDTPGADPRNLGFDVNIAGHAAGGLASYLGEANFGNVAGATEQSRFAVPGLEKYWGKDIFATKALTIEALRAVDSVRRKAPSKPFFLYMSHYAIHVPLDIDKRYYQSYIDRGLDPSQARYAGLIEGMDKSLGDIAGYLDAHGLSKNTIIVFISDNGGISACGRSGVKDRHNWPLRSGKGSALEGGVRVPMIVLDPSVARGGEVVTTPIEIADMLPTILDMASVKRYKTTQTIDGESFMPLLKGSTTINDRIFVWHFPNRWDCDGEGIGTYSSIRHGDYKFIYYYDGQPAELYNLSTDLSEMSNLATNPAYGSVRDRLTSELTAFLKSKNAQLPYLKSNGEQCEYPR